MMLGRALAIEVVLAIPVRALAIPFGGRQPSPDALPPPPPREPDAKSPEPTSGSAPSPQPELAPEPEQPPEGAPKPETDVGSVIASEARARLAEYTIEGRLIDPLPVVRGFLDPIIEYNRSWRDEDQ